MIFGSTGKYPDGKLNESDEGEIVFGVAADTNNNVVIINFGKPVMWLGLPQATAIQLAKLILKHAGNIKSDENLATPYEDYETGHETMGDA